MLSVYEIWDLAQERQHVVLQQAAKERLLRRAARWLTRGVQVDADAAATQTARPEAASIGLLMKTMR